ncbi:hypothetical protein [Nocardioides campestrisoli]|uniref:hypothetical protein n=1 Tax=Nocardioides campestrisoli TaxID=2736757 RepID=UPI0015E77BA4|nr:hypothetical protein [Nocardioides campestrisoli]
MAENDEKSSGLDIDWLRTVGGAMAAVTSAVLLSTLGAAGTIIGAALGSVAATVGTALYTRGLAKSKDTVAQARAVALRARPGLEMRRIETPEPGTANPPADDGSAGRTAPDLYGDADRQDEADRQDQDPADLDPATSDPDQESASLGDRLRALPWKRVTLMAVLVFVVALGAITAFELVTGRSVSSRTGGGDGGTTIGQVSREVSDVDRPARREPREREPGETPSESSSPSAPATPTPSPSSTPTDGSSPTPSEPTLGSTPESTPTDQPTPSEPAPSPTASGAG